MKKLRKQRWETANYTDNPDLPAVKDIEIIPDVLPRPEDLIFRPKGVKITITLDPESITFFKMQAEKLHTSYQRMIRNLIANYVAKQTKVEPRRAR